MRHASRSARLLVPILCLSALGPLRAEEDALTIVERAFEAAKANEALAEQYVYHERIEERRFDRRGGEKKRQSHTWDVTLFEGGDYRRLIARDDRPLDARAEAREQKKFARYVRQLERETPAQRARRRARIDKERRDGEEFLAEITRAFDFRLLREEAVAGLDTWVIAAEPRPGYRPSGRLARVLPKVRATLWVAQADHAWVQADIETLGDITWAAVFRLRKGAQIHFRQRQLDDGPWVTERWNVRLRAQIALVYRLDAEMTGTYSNFRRFTTDTTVTGWSPTD